MCNFRNTKDLEHDCTFCINFTSYAQEYEDELEPSEYGTCPEVDDMVGEGKLCAKFKNDKIMVTIEVLMKEGFEAFFKARKCFEEAAKLYAQKAIANKERGENALNVNSAVHFLAEAYDEISAIWENDIQPLTKEQ